MGSTRSQLSQHLMVLATQQQGWLSMAQLTQGGVTESQRRANVAAGRWYAVPGRGVVVLGVVGADVRAFPAALARVGPQARLGGVSALMVDGLTGYAEALPHVWVPKSVQKGDPGGVVLHETRRWGASDVAASGLPRSTPAVAAIQGALWAVSLRQATLVLTMAIQQDLVGADDVRRELDRVRRHRFRRALSQTLCDITGGSESLNELDFLGMCRARGLPEPERQEARRTHSGQIVQDAIWSRFRLTVEIQGAGHLVLDKRLSDEVRLLDLATLGDTMVPVSAVTLRTDPEPFFAALARLLRSRGWLGPRSDDAA